MCVISCAWNCLKPLFKVSLIAVSIQVLAGMLVVAQSNNRRGVIICCSYGRFKLVLASSRLTVPTAITSPFDMGSG